MKKNNGITLIALVISIIVLIILAGVAINTLINNGIIEKAKTATQEYKNAQDYEETQIAKYSNDINSYVDGNRETITISKEEYEQLKNANSYSTDEKVVGTWIDGSNIYKKTVYIGNLPNSTYKDVPHNILNCKNIINLYGFTSGDMPIQFVATTGAYSIGAYADSTNIRVYCASNRSSTVGYVTLEYTKTTN